MHGSPHPWRRGASHKGKGGEEGKIRLHRVWLDGWVDVGYSTQVKSWEGGLLLTRYYSLKHLTRPTALLLHSQVWPTHYWVHRDAELQATVSSVLHTRASTGPAAIAKRDS